MFASRIQGCGQEGKLGSNGGDEDNDAVAELLALEGIDGELGGSDGVVDVEVEDFERVGGHCVGALVEVPEV